MLENTSRNTRIIVKNAPKNATLPEMVDALKSIGEM